MKDIRGFIDAKINTFAHITRVWIIHLLLSPLQLTSKTSFSSWLITVIEKAVSIWLIQGPCFKTVIFLYSDSQLLKGRLSSSFHQHWAEADRRGAQHHGAWGAGEPQAAHTQFWSTRTRSGSTQQGPTKGSSYRPACQGRIKRDPTKWEEPWKACAAYGVCREIGGLWN